MKDTLKNVYMTRLGDPARLMQYLVRLMRDDRVIGYAVLSVAAITLALGRVLPELNSQEHKEPLDSQSGDEVLRLTL